MRSRSLGFGKKTPYYIQIGGNAGCLRNVQLIFSQPKVCVVISQHLYSLSLLTRSGLDDAAGHLILNRPINCFPGSAENLQLSRQWYQECQTSHTKCGEIQQTYMPLRVLHIIDGCDSCDFHVTLKTRTNDEPIESFAALSYCWGGDQPYKTTKARMQSGQTTLEWHKLPKSLQDALKITSALGLRYLVSCV